MTESPLAPVARSALKLRRVAKHPGIRVLAWDGDILYGCCGYPDRLACELGRAPSGSGRRLRPVGWRSLTSRNALTYRLLRDGFHAVAILGNPKSNQTMVGAVGCTGLHALRTAMHFKSHIDPARHKAAAHHGRSIGRNLLGEYFYNRERAEVHIYASIDGGLAWQIAYTFPAGSIRHVHNIIYDRWGDCLWILTGDEGAECKVLRASCDLRSIEVVLAGNQQARAVAAIPTETGLYLSTDTPSEKNHVYRLDRAGNVEQVATGQLFDLRLPGRQGNVFLHDDRAQRGERQP